jgi:hypothetical protein
MADYSSDGTVRVDYVATIANPAAPDVSSELSSTTPLSLQLTPDGWSPASEQAEVPTTSLASTFRTSVPGTRGGPIELTLKKGDVPASDTVYNLFKTGPSGYLVSREAQGGAAAAWAASQTVTVIPGKAGPPRMQVTAENTPRTYKVTWFPSLAPSEDVLTVA